MNRVAFVDRVEQLTREKQSYVLACINVDQFSRINEAHGYAAGDILLRQIGKTATRRLAVGAAGAAVRRGALRRW